MEPIRAETPATQAPSHRPQRLSSPPLAQPGHAPRAAWEYTHTITTNSMTDANSYTNPVADLGGQPASVAERLFQRLLPASVTKTMICSRASPANSATPPATMRAPKNTNTNSTKSKNNNLNYNRNPLSMQTSFSQLYPHITGSGASDTIPGAPSARGNVPWSGSAKKAGSIHVGREDDCPADAPPTRERGESEGRGKGGSGLGSAKTKATGCDGCFSFASFFFLLRVVIVR
jgi:hypothetical protein